MAPPVNLTSPANSGTLSIFAYCFSSILMVVTNKYVLSGLDYNLNFLLLAVQVGALSLGRRNADRRSPSFASSRSKVSRLPASYNSATSTPRRPGNVRVPPTRTLRLTSEGFPISLLLIGMIYTGTWVLKYLSIPVYTIFKNLTIILIAYGEVLWFGGSVTPITLFSFGLMVLSSIVAAWADIQHAISSMASDEAHSHISTLNAGYMWMFANCICTALYVLSMRKRIKMLNFKDFDSMCSPM